MHREDHRYRIDRMEKALATRAYAYWKLDHRSNEDKSLEQILEVFGYDDPAIVALTAIAIDKAGLIGKCSSCRDTAALANGKCVWGCAKPTEPKYYEDMFVLRDDLEEIGASLRSALEDDVRPLTHCSQLDESIKVQRLQIDVEEVRELMSQAHALARACEAFARRIRGY